jgi:hypothetical protein
MLTILLVSLCVLTLYGCGASALSSEKELASGKSPQTVATDIRECLYDTVDLAWSGTVYVYDVNYYVESRNGQPLQTRISGDLELKEQIDKDDFEKLLQLYGCEGVVIDDFDFSTKYEVQAKTDRPDDVIVVDFHSDSADSETQLNDLLNISIYTSSEYSKAKGLTAPQKKDMVTVIAEGASDEISFITIEEARVKYGQLSKLEREQE